MDLELRQVRLRPGIPALTHTFRPGLTVVEARDPRDTATLLRTLALRVRPKRGELRISGRSVWSLPAPEQVRVRRTIGFAPAGADLPDGIPVRAGLRYLAALWQVPPGSRADRELDRWGLSDLQDQPLGTLSFGERRRFILAASLVMDPALWILENPFDGLDLPGRTALSTLLTGTRLGIGPVELAVVAGPEGSRQAIVADDRLFV